MVTPGDARISCTPELSLQASHIIASQSNNNRYVSNATGCLAKAHSRCLNGILHSKITFKLFVDVSSFNTFLRFTNSRIISGPLLLLRVLFNNNNALFQQPAQKTRASSSPNLSTSITVTYRQSYHSDSDSQNFGAATPEGRWQNLIGIEIEYLSYVSFRCVPAVKGLYGPTTNSIALAVLEQFFGQKYWDHVEFWALLWSNNLNFCSNTAKFECYSTKLQSYFCQAVMSSRAYRTRQLVHG